MKDHCLQSVYPLLFKVLLTYQVRYLPSKIDISKENSNSYKRKQTCYLIKGQSSLHQFIKGKANWTLQF